jgi:hypothetical protein
MSDHRVAHIFVSRVLSTQNRSTLRCRCAGRTLRSVDICGAEEGTSRDPENDLNIPNMGLLKAKLVCFNQNVTQNDI